MKKIVVQVSGGLDSTVMMAKAIGEYGRDNVYPITFNDDSVMWKIKDSIAVKKAVVDYKINDKLFVCNIPQSDLLESTVDVEYPDVGFIPGLKMFMNIASLSYAQKVLATEVWIGNMKDNVYKDEKIEFSESIQNLYNDTYNCKIFIVCPFFNYSRSDVIKLGISIGVDIYNTLSCGNEKVPGSYNCGICDWCKHRISGFKESGVEDKTIYIMRNI